VILSVFENRLRAGLV